MARSMLRAALGAAAAILAFAASAAAQQVHEIQAGGDSVTGSISDAADVDRVPVRLVEGAFFDVSLKAAKGSPLHPTLTILDPDRAVDAGAALLFKPSKKGNAVAMKKLPIARTGLRWIEIRGADGTLGDWILTTKVKLPRSAKGLVNAGPTAGVASFPFTSPGNATATIAVKAARGSAANPVLDSLLDPTGAPLIIDFMVPGKTGFTLKSQLLPRPGRHELNLAPGTGGDGPVTISAKWKVPKPFKRTLVESQIVVDPFVTAVTPTGADTATTTQVDLSTAFLEQGATVVFRKEPTVVTIPAGSLAISETGVSFQQSFTSFQKGTYDIEVRNPDGGVGVLPQSFTVVNAPATLASIAPAFGFDNNFVDVVISGAYINGGATASLERSGVVIPGTNVLAASTSLSCRFDIRGRPAGFWDVVVANPDAAPTTLAGAFEVRNSPPTVSALSPSTNLAGFVVPCTIDGADLDATPTVRLRRTGESDIPGTSVVWVSSGQITCTFDTTGAAVGKWDLQVTNPDAQSATLAGAFTVSGPVGSATQVIGATSQAQAPPAICYNAARDEFLAAWVDRNSSSGTWDLYVQRLDAAGTPVGSRVSVSPSASTVLKRDPAVGWDSTNDQYLVAWAELVAVSSNVTAKHPSYGYTTVTSIFTRRLAGSDLSFQGSTQQISDSDVFGGYSMYDFNNVRPSVCWDPKGAVWQIAYMQEWSSRNVNAYGYDDFDCIQRSLDPATDKMGPTGGIAFTPQHEGEPQLVYDPGTQTVIAAYNYRGTETSPLEAKLAGTTVSTDSSSSYTDLRMAMDTDTGRVLLTWTRDNGSGVLTVEGGAYATPTLVGTLATIGSGSGNHFQARPLYNPDLKQPLIAWTRKDGSGNLSVRVRRGASGGTGGLVLQGVEVEASSGGGDEAAPAALYSVKNRESVVFWARTMTFDATLPYKGNALGGTYYGGAFWIQRYR